LPVACGKEDEMKKSSDRILSIVILITAGFWGVHNAAGQPKKASEQHTTKASATPRLPDGHPDLGNNKGSWSGVAIHDIAGTSGGNPGNIDTQIRNKELGYGIGGPSLVDKVVDVPFQPWAKKLYDERASKLWKEDPEGMCLPPGLPRMAATPFPFQIYQLPDRLMFVYEGGAHMWRFVYMDGRSHSQAAMDYPTYLGESIGHWEGDTLVVDAIGFNDRTWIDAAGHPHSEKLHVIERYTRVDENTLHFEATVDDRGAYTKPWTTSWNLKWTKGIEPLEYICQEGNLDLPHLVGTPDAAPGVKTK
jgi:hypothetical protein